MSTLSQRQIVARREVIDFLIEACSHSPAADDPHDWAESANIACDGDDLADAFIDVRVALEAMRGFLS